MNKKVSNNIRKHRNLKGYSQDYMAVRLGVCQAAYAKIENNNTKITIDRVQEIATLLGVDIKELLELS